MEKSLYTYAVLYHETSKKGKLKGTKILINPTTELAESEQALAFKITREIPEEYADKYEDIQILIKPF